MTGVSYGTLASSGDVSDTAIDPVAPNHPVDREPGEDPMRYGLCSVSSTVMIGAVLSVGTVLSMGTALADPRPGWTDPPAKPSAATPAPAAPEAPTADKPTVATSAPTGDAAAKSETPPASSDKAAGPTPGLAETRRTAMPREDRAGPRHAPRRLARAPALPMASPAPVGLADDRFPEWAGRAQRLTLDYLDSVSAPGDAMVASAPRFYGDRVRFHGRTVSLAALISEKRRFVRRWPERRYDLQRNSLSTACNASGATCIVHATFDYRADSPARGARSRGTAELVLEIGFSGRQPVIVSETSRVLRRFAPGPLSAVATTRHGA